MGGITESVGQAEFQGEVSDPTRIIGEGIHELRLDEIAQRTVLELASPAGVGAHEEESMAGRGAGNDAFRADFKDIGDEAAEVAKAQSGSEEFPFLVETEVADLR